jgi:hypothetical protein
MCTPLYLQILNKKQVSERYRQLTQLRAHKYLFRNSHGNSQRRVPEHCGLGFLFYGPAFIGIGYLRRPSRLASSLM